MSIWDTLLGPGEYVTIDNTPVDFYSTFYQPEVEIPYIFDIPEASPTGSFVFDTVGGNLNFRDPMSPSLYTLSDNPTINELQQMMNGAGLGPDVGSTGPYISDGARQQFLDTALQNLPEVYVDRAGNLVNGDGSPLNSSVIKQLNDALASPLGRIAATMGLGGLGMLAGNLAAGSPASIRYPSPAPATPAVSATRSALEGILAGSGQQNLSDVFNAGLKGQAAVSHLMQDKASQELIANAAEAPMAAGVRMQALNDLPGLMRPTQTAQNAAQTSAGVSRLAQSYLPGAPSAGAPGVPGAAAPAGTTAPPLSASASGLAPLSDPVQAGLAQELERAFRGETPNPALDEKHRLENAQLESYLFRTQGDNWRNTTAGGQAWQQQQQRQNMEREQYRTNVIATYSPLEAARRSYNQDFPLRALSTFLPEERSRAGQEEQVRQNQTTQNTALSQLGLSGPLSLSTGLGNYVPIVPLMDIGGASSAQQQQNVLQNQAALEAFRQEQQNRQSLSSGIGGLFGAAAKTMTTPNYNPYALNQGVA